LLIAGVADIAVTPEDIDRRLPYRRVRNGMRARAKTVKQLPNGDLLCSGLGDADEKSFMVLAVRRYGDGRIALYDYRPSELKATRDLTYEREDDVNDAELLPGDRQAITADRPLPVRIYEHLKGLTPYRVEAFGEYFIYRVDER